MSLGKYSQKVKKKTIYALQAQMFGEEGIKREKVKEEMTGIRKESK